MHRRLLLNALSLTAIFGLIFSLLPGAAAKQDTQQSTPNTGSLQAFANGQSAGQCPLKHTSVKAEVSGFLSRVTVTQDFENPFTDKIEAFYSFPLPQLAAVDDMTMLIGDRTIKGKIMRREEAQKEYAAAKQLGKVAALLDQNRPNIFTQSVANILPGQQIRIVISYVETLKYEDGAYEWSFPMVVGPRYNPAGTTDPTDKTDQSSTSPPIEGMRAGHDISLELSLDAGVQIESLNSKTHETEIDRPDPTRALIRLKDRNTIPNKDFVLTYQVAGPAITDAVLAHRSEKGGYFTLILQPPQRVYAEDVTPKEIVFVVDTSGSMSGFPIETAKETAMLALDKLYPHDTFNLITFSGDDRVLFGSPVPATPENLRLAKEFLAGHHGSGGTEMMKAIKTALKPSDSQEHVRIVCFMTDGYVGNDTEIIAEVKKYKNARVFAMGFGTSPNRYLLDNMAKYGRGEVDYALNTVDMSVVANRFHERVRSPLLTDISIDWSNLPVTDIYPQRIPDLFSAKPLVLSGRYLQGATGTIVLQGKMAGENFVRQIPVELPATENSHDVLATLWARRKIDDLMVQDMSAANSGDMKPEPKEEITQLGLKYKLMTQFTSFIAVDEVIFTGPEPARPATVPLQVPAGTIQGTMSETVTVTGSSNATINSVEILVGSTVTSLAIQNLPIQGRSFQSLVELAPGTTFGPSQQSTAPSTVDLSTNGQRANANTFMLDGVSANFGIAAGGQNPGPSAAGSTPALTASGGANGLVAFDATQEVNVTTAYTEPKYGRMPGAQVNLITRSGTNDFHGSLFHFFGNNSLDANDWFANNRGLQQPARRLNNFGGTIGGPIVKDETFFFASYEGLRLRRPLTGITDVPSLASRANAVPAIQPFLNAFPLPTGAARPDGFAEFAATFANAARHDVGSIRVDHNRVQWTFSGKYAFADSAADERGIGGFSLNTLSRTRSRAQTITGSLDRTLSPSVIFNIRANYSRLSVGRSYELDEFGGGSKLSPNTALNFDLNARGAALLIGNKASNLQRQFNLVGATDIVSGDHSFKFGADYRRLWPIIGLRTLEESVLFDGVDQAMTGNAARIGIFNRAPAQKPVFNNLSLYAQDEWRQSKRLTLTYGLRWELNPPPSIDDISPIAVDQADDPAQLKAVAPGTSLWETTFLNFAPRFGFAYRLVGTNDPKLVVRGGAGVLYDLGHERAGDVFADSIPFVSGGPVLPAIVFDPHLKLPYTLNWNVSLQQSLGHSQSISASYVGAAGRRLLHTQTLFDQNPAFPFLRLTTNAGRSDYRALQVQFNRAPSSGLTSSVSYTWSRSFDNVCEDSARAVLMTSANPSLDRGPSDFDVRHTLTGLVSYEIPAAFERGIGNTLFRNWAVDSIFNARSAKPVNVVYMFPTPFGVAYFRPDVAGQPFYVFDPNAAGGRTINPAAFAEPANLEQGNASRNSLRGFPLYQIDLALRRHFNFSETLSIQLQVDAFNLFNHTNFEDPFGRDRVLGTMFGNTFTPNATFGQSTSLLNQGVSGTAGAFGSFYNTGGPRALRFSLKLRF